MTQAGGVGELGERIEALLAELETRAGGEARTRAEELVRLVTGLYGTALEHVLDTVVDDGGARAALLADPLVSSLLLVHGLHPVDTATRVQKALDEVRPFLGTHAGGVELVSIDDQGVAHLRLEGTCHGCPSSAVTVEGAIVGAVTSAAPELSGVDVEGLVAEPTAPGPQFVEIGPCPVPVDAVTP